MNSLFYIFLFLNFVPFIFCDGDLSKAVACMNLITIKMEDKVSDQYSYSQILLSCFIKITDLEAKEMIISSQNENNPIEEKDFDIKKLTDTSILDELKNEELDEYKYRLENAIKELRKHHEKREKRKKNTRDSRADDDIDDEDYKRAHPSRGNSFGAFMRKTRKLLKTINSSSNFVIAGIVLYFVYILFGKWCKSKKSKTKDDDKGKNKGKKKNKKSE